jgi:diguanylate cyclase (GGDEF)-like protein
MLARLLLTKKSPSLNLPRDVYTSLVGSLFSDPRTLIVGAFGTILAAFVTAWKTGEPLLLICAIAMAVITCVRATDMAAFRKRRAKVMTVDAARYWEMRYVIGSTAYVVVMGVWCFLTFVITSDPLVQLLSFSMALANMIGVSGRNYGSALLVNAQLIGLGAPMTAGLLSMRESYYLVFACVLVPFFMSQKAIADRLRRTLLNAVTATADVKLLADQFDTALNNMPHALCMFDSARRLVVFNQRAATLFHLPNVSGSRGPPIDALLSGAAASGMIDYTEVEPLNEEFERRLAGLAGGKLFINTKDERVLSVSFQPMENGGSVVLIEDVTDQRRAEAEINRLARYDALTGLPNRTAFQDQMNAIVGGLKPNRMCALLFLDLDQFKEVNDTLGHPAGDALLCAVAERLRSIVRKTDPIARFGGDEFVILQCGVSRHEQVERLARAVVETLAKPFAIDGHDVVIGASVGIALAPTDGSDAHVLMKNADMALYRAKAAGRKGWRFFEPDMDIKARARRQLESDLRNAVATGAFEVFFQPIVNLNSARISVCEALLRWPHPERGLISPLDFIPLAEETGLIIDLGNWVLQRACAECAKWPDDVCVAVNLSSVQFARGDVLTSVVNALKQARLPARRLQIEITESVLLQNTDAMRSLLQRLRDLGVGISLDDFGTGYSSLSYLHNFPLQKVKIDRSFLENLSPRSLTLLSNVARLSAELGMSVTMEGVETRSQLAFITADGNIDEAQGFLFSAPVPAKEIAALLDPQAMHDMLQPVRAQKVA